MNIWQSYDLWVIALQHGIEMSREEIIEKMRLSGKPNPVWIQNKLRVSYEEAQRICEGLDFRTENIYITRMNAYLAKL